MDEGGKILLLLWARPHIARAGENGRYVTVEIHGRELDGMARDHANGEERRPAAVHDRMVPDTEARSLGGGSIDHLGEADGAGGGPVDREGIEAPSPAPVGALDRIAAALDLRQRGQELGRDRAGGIGAKQRPVVPPRLGRLLVEGVADESEQLGRLADHLIDEVREREGRKHNRHAARDAHRARCARKLSPRPARAPSPAAKAGEEFFALSWHAWCGSNYGSASASS